MITEGRLIICDRCKTERFFGHKSDGPLTNDPYSILNGWHRIIDLDVDLCPNCFDEWEACKEHQRCWNNALRSAPNCVRPVLNWQENSGMKIRLHPILSC